MVRRRLGVWGVLSALAFVLLAVAAAPSALATSSVVEVKDESVGICNAHVSCDSDAGGGPIEVPENIKKYAITELPIGLVAYKGTRYFKPFVEEELPCHSGGAAEGEVVTKAMTYHFGYINAKRKEVGVEELPTSGTLIAQFTCGGNTVELRGGVIGKLAAEKGMIKEGSSLAYEVAINPETGKDAVTHLEHGPEVVMEESVNGGPFEVVPWEDSGKLSVTGGEFEIKTAKTGPEFVIKPNKPKKEKK